MKIGIDARTLRNRRGIGNVVFHLLHGLSKINEDCSFIIYIDDEKSIELIPNDSRFTVVIIRNKIYPFWEQISLPLRVIKDELDILHCPGNSAPVFLPRRVKLVLSIMDVMFMFPASQLPKSPSWYQRIGRVYLKYIVPVVAMRASAITTISSSSRSDILKYIKVPEDRISVILLAANSACRIICDEDKIKSLLTKFQLNGSFILALGALDPRKNTAMILKSFSILKKNYASDIKLVVVGLSIQAINFFHKLAVDLGISKEVELVGFINEDELVVLYNAAEMLVYPSLYEGFGLPVLEAMICATPVITSTCGSIPEIAGDAALMVNPLDADAIANEIMRLLTNRFLYVSLVEKGKLRAELFSWKMASEKIFAVYKTVAAFK